MMNQDQEVTDATIIDLLWRITQNLRAEDRESEKCILNTQKLLHLALYALDKKTVKLLPFDLTQELKEFVEYINRKTKQELSSWVQHAQTGQQGQAKQQWKLFSKAIDILMVKSLAKHVSSKQLLGELKVQTFNNLACVLRIKGKLVRALKAVQYALEIEEWLCELKDYPQKHNIVKTYINKSAILSMLRRHELAVEVLKKGFRVLEEVKEGKAVGKTEYIFFQSILHYNLAAEYEHLRLQSSALQHYLQSLQHANLEDGIRDMQDKVRPILKKYLEKGVKGELRDRVLKAIAIFKS